VPPTRTGTSSKARLPSIKERLEPAYVDERSGFLKSRTTARYDPDISECAGGGPNVKSLTASFPRDISSFKSVPSARTRIRGQSHTQAIIRASSCPTSSSPPSSLHAVTSSSVDILLRKIATTMGVYCKAPARSRKITRYAMSQ
jgi:hypothetical protein